MENEYQRIKRMNHQKHIMKENKKAILSPWKKSRELIESVIQTLSPKEEKLKNALELSAKALLRMQVQEENQPLKRIHLNNMNGQPAWVVSEDHDGRWGIVDADRETILFPTYEGVEEVGWFDYMYIFKYKKEIKDYTELLKKYGLTEE